MSNKKIGVLFGAGVEILYGMPSGKEFAKNILTPPECIENDAKIEICKYLADGFCYEKFSKNEIDKYVKENSESYESLLMHYYKYLFSDKEFTTPEFKKIASFLYAIRSYVLKTFNSKKQISGSYYTDIKAHDDIEWVIATTNYSNIKRLVGTKVKSKNIHYLNGNVETFINLENYDLVDISKESGKKLIEMKKLVPLMFLQSTLKPYLSFDVFEKYACAYKQLKKCDIIGIIGFGFNNDDSLINSMIRQLIKAGKEIIYFKYIKDENSKDLAYLSESKEWNAIKIEKIDDDRKVNDEKNWVDFLKEKKFDNYKFFNWHFSS